MRVLILVDARFAIHERALIERVLIGLANEGVVAQVVLPKDRKLEEAGFDLVSEPIWYADRGLALTQRIRANQIAKRAVRDLQSAKDPDQLTGLIDIVHIFGGGAWSMGRELARLLDAGMVFEVWRAGLLSSANDLQLDGDDRALFLVPEKPFEKGLLSGGQTKRVQVAQWAAQVPSEPSTIFREGKDVSVVLMSSGRQKEQCIAAFDGIADSIESNPDVMVFANLELVERTGLWNRVVERKLEDRFTIIDRSEDRRDLLLRCDLLVYPDTLCEERTLLLDAMGTGMVIIAGNDDSIAPIYENPGVLIVDRPARSAWAAQLDSCLKDIDKSRSLGLEARDYIIKNRRAAKYIESILDAYQGLAESGQTQEA
jgi:glycosyltransferase involved in cell wall biosynthesis